MTREPGAAQEVGLPQRQHGAAQRLLAERGLLRRERDAIAFGQQLGHLHLAVDRALAPHLGRMGGQHRRDMAGGEEGRELRARDARLPGARERVGHRALAWCRSGEGVRAGATDVVLVLGDIGQVREEAEGADHLDGVSAREAVQRAFELAPRGRRPRRDGSEPRSDGCARRLPNTASPCCSRKVSPRIRPSRRMSSRSGRSLSGTSVLLRSAMVTDPRGCFEIGRARAIKSLPCAAVYSRASGAG